jgi:hypothetical protein
MAKKSVEFQFAVITMLIAFFLWLYFKKDFFYPQLTIIMNSFRYVFLITVGLLAIPPLVNLILQMSLKEDYDDKLYYIILRSISHLIFLAMFLSILAIIFAYSVTYLSRLDKLILSLILSIILLSVIIYYSGNFFEKTFNIKLFNPFSHLRQFNQPSLHISNQLPVLDNPI